VCDGGDGGEEGEGKCELGLVRGMTSPPTRKKVDEQCLRLESFESYDVRIAAYKNLITVKSFYPQDMSVSGKIHDKIVSISYSLYL
jgi:hypothetical protein